MRDGDADASQKKKPAGRSGLRAERVAALLSRPERSCGRRRAPPPQRAALLRCGTLYPSRPARRGAARRGSTRGVLRRIAPHPHFYSLDPLHLFPSHERAHGARHSVAVRGSAWLPLVRPPCQSVFIPRGRLADWPARDRQSRPDRGTNVRTAAKKYTSLRSLGRRPAVDRAVGRPNGEAERRVRTAGPLRALPPQRDAPA